MTAWLILILSVALEVYGFATTGIFRQQMWSPLGLTRLAGFAIAYTALAGIALASRPRICVPLLLAVALVWTMLAVGVLPLFAVGMFLLASFQLGRVVLGRRFASWEPIDEVLTLLAGVAIYSSVQGLLAHFPVNSAASALVLLGAPTVAAVYDRRISGAHRAPLQWGKFAIPVAWIGFPLAAHWLVALKPEVSTDGLAMHLVIPSFTAFHHFWSFDFRQAMWALMPMSGDWCYTLVYLIGGEAAARLVNLALLVILAALIFLVCRRQLSEGAAAAVTALFLSTPLIQLVTGSLFVENFWTVLVAGAFVALLRAHETARRNYFYICAILLGVAISAKFGAIAFAALFALIAGVVLLRFNARMKTAKTAAASLALLLVFAAPPYVTAYVKTGNPVFPYLNDVFHSPYIDPAFFSRDIRFERPMDFRFPYDATFHTDRFIEGLPGAAGFQYLLLLPLCVFSIAAAGTFVGWAALASGVIGCYLMFIQQANVRYAYPGMALLTIAFAAALARYVGRRHFYRALIGICVLVTIANIYFGGASGYLHRDFWLNPLNKNEQRSYIDTYAPVRGLVDYLNRTAPGEPVMFISTNQIAGLQGPALTSTWHNRAIALRLGTAGSPREILQIANDFKTRYFISPVPESGSLSLPPFEQFRAAMTEPEYRNGSFYISKLKSGISESALADPLKPMPSESSPAVEPTTAFASGDYDDNDSRLVYHGRWAHDAPYPKAFRSTMTFSNAIGATLSFSFTGTEVTYVYTRAYNCGRAAVSIDGRNIETIDGYVPDTDWQVRKTWRGLAPGVHRVEIRVLPEKNRNSEGFFVGIDAIVVG